MICKCCMFDIEMLDELVVGFVVGIFFVGKGDVQFEFVCDQCCGLMVIVISEIVELSCECVWLEVEIWVENDVLVQEYVWLKCVGLIIDLIVLDVIDMQKLICDRKFGVDYELVELVVLICEIGLLNLIWVEFVGEGCYELIQGWCRLLVYCVLLEEMGDVEVWGCILVGIVVWGDELEQFYCCMVDENFVCKDILFVEMVQLVLYYVMDLMIEENDFEKVVVILFKLVGYQKCSYICSFIWLVEGLGEMLFYVVEVLWVLGLVLFLKLDEVLGLVVVIWVELKDWDICSIKDELDVLWCFVGQGVDEVLVFEMFVVKFVLFFVGKVWMMFQIQCLQGSVKCIVVNGWLEIWLVWDFLVLDCCWLEVVVWQMLDNLE